MTGCGAALDAVTRGLRVGLVEARDLAAGTSSRSSKLFHGGLRYLEQLNFALVFEALKERSLALTKLSPHLAKPVPFLYPLTRTGGRPLVRRAGDRRVRRDGRRPRRTPPSAAPRPQEDPGVVPLGQPRDAQGLDQVLRGPGRRRPAHHDDRPDRRALRGRGRHQHPGDRVPARGGPGGRRPGTRSGVRATSSRSGPSRRSTPPGSGWTSCRRCSADAASSRCGRRRASTWWCPATGSTPGPG